ncbi:MAG: TRAP transporter small permease subunit [Rhodospirillales bacterium]
MSDFQQVSPVSAFGSDSGDVSRTTTLLVRAFGWGVLAALAVFVVSNYFTHWQGWPGAAAAFSGATGETSTMLAWAQAAAYPVVIAVAIIAVLRSSYRTLRQDSERISGISAYVVRAAFFAVLYVGLVDAAISFLRVEGLLPGLIGEPLTIDLGRSTFRGVYVHIPLILAGIVTAAFSRSLGFTWLALLVVVAELLIVVTRFIFSYEQAFMADLVRFWYAALFLFASAYTLLHEGHVRVDVLYTGMSPRTKGWVNAMGSLLLGISLCWVVLAIGLGDKTAIINSPILAFETTQTGFGMYVKYIMAGYLAIFAITMMIQFVSYFMESVADLRGEPGGRDHESHGIS